MQRKVLTIVCFTLFAQPALAASAPAPVSTDRLNEVAQYYVDTHQFMGSVLMARGDQVIFSKAYGSANLEWNVPNTTNTKYRIGSVTKQFTAAAILLLEERGKLKVDDPIKKFYPDAPAAWEKVTIHHLLTHTSGIPNFTSFPDYGATEALPTTPQDTVRRFRDKPLDFAPGTEMRYSNSGYILLGVILEKVGGTTYTEFLDENIFKPLGMNDSGYESNTALTPRRATGYTLGAKGPENASYVNMTVPFAAGALYSTVEDLLRWEQGLFGNKIISAASLEKMTTPAKNGYALGVAIGEIAGARVVQHGGGISGFNSYLAYYPDTKVTIVALSNLNGRGAESIAGRFGTLAQGKPVVLHSERKSIKVPRATLEKYVGTYQLSPGFDIFVAIDGERLTGHATGQSPIPLAAETETKFYPEAFEAELEFQLDAGGKVTGAVWRQNGQDTLAPRTSDKVPAKP